MTTVYLIENVQSDYAASDAIKELANDTLSPYIDQEDVPEWAIAQLIAELKEIER